LILHNETVEWLKQKLDAPFDGKTVVVTHHGPSLKCAHPQFGNNTIGSCFISDLDYLVKKADVWCFGHTHASLDTRVGKCRLVSNQRGYSREVIPGGFRQDWFINI
jgi:predicted phosphodiesterase